MPAITLEQKADFVITLSGKAANLGKDLKDRDDKARLIEELVGEGLQGARDDLRKAMNFKVKLKGKEKSKDGKDEVHAMDKRGQRKSIETEDARSKYASLDKESAFEVEKALRMVMAKKKTMQEAVVPGKTDAKGQPLKMFSAKDIIEELFKPLMREGLLPDNLLTDDDSPVAHMLREVFASYKEMLKQEKLEKEEARSKTDSDRNNAGSKMDRLASLGKTASNFIEGQISVVASKTGMTPEEVKRAGSIASKSVKVMGSMAKAITDGTALDKKLNPPKTNTLTTVEVPPTSSSKEVIELAVELSPSEKLPTVQAVLAAVDVQLRQANTSLDELLKFGREKVMQVLKKFSKLMDSDGVAIAGDVANVLLSGTTGIIDIIESSGERYQAGVDQDVGVRLAELRAGARSLSRGVEEALRLAFKASGAELATAVAGGFAAHFAPGEVVDMLKPSLGPKPDTRPEATAVVALLGKAMSAALADVHAQLKPFGEKLSEAYATATSGVEPGLAKAFKEGNLADPANCLLVLVEPVAKAVAAVVQDNAFTNALNDSQVANAINAKAKDLTEDIDAAVRLAELRTGVFTMLRGIQAALNTGLKPRGVAISTAVAGGFIASIDGQGIVQLLAPALGNAPKPAPDPKQVVKLLGKAMKQAMGDVHSDLQSSGDLLEQEYTQTADGVASQLEKPLEDGQLKDPATFLSVLVDPASKAVEKLALDQPFILALEKEEVRKAIGAKAMEENQALEEELDSMNEELEDFERELVLMDEGGMEAARQQTLDKMIAQLKADQMDLDIVLKAGSLLSSFGSSVTKLGTDSKNVSAGQSVSGQLGNAPKTVATQVANSVVPALEAAELVMKMAVTIIKIAKRYELASKFKADVEKAKKAGSYLLDSIQNFYNNKFQQQVFAGIELALQTVQLAGAVCASVPEPITMAVGRALNSAAKAGEAARDLAQTAYNEATLRKGWKVTLEAINNPANRRAGLDALHHNSTLAVHSVAWAATQGDAMAMEILRSCKVDAQTMANDDSSKDKVIEYLETLLHEDMQFKDTEKLNVNWVPSPLVISFAGWFTLKKRARTANPPLSEAPTPEIDKAFKQLDLQTRMDTIQAHPQDQSLADLERFIKETEKLQGLIDNYEPATADLTPHTEMAEVCKVMSRMLTARITDLQDALTKTTKP